MSKLRRPHFHSLVVYDNGKIICNGNRIEEIGDPIDDTDACSKNYIKQHLLNVGDLKWSIINTDHNGWLKCDGRSLSRVTYASLFAIIGTSFGSVDGNTFKLPDTRGRTIGGIGTGTGLTNRTLGQTVGEETHTITVNEMPSHSHTGTVDSSGSHTHTINDPGHTHTQNTVNDDYNNSGGRYIC